MFKKLKDLGDDLLAGGFTLFATSMVKIQPIWDKYKIWISIALGVAIGLVIGWGILPVQWENASAGHLYPDYQAYYLASVAEDYVETKDKQMVIRRLGLDLPKSKDLPWLAKKDTLTKDLTRAIDKSQSYGLGARESMALTVLQNDMAEIRTLAEKASSAKKGISLQALGILAFIFLLVMGIVAAIWFLVINKRRAPEPEEAFEPEEYGALITGEPGVEPPVKSFTTTYVMGDDFFDPSFSIEIGPDFLGECGIGISETIGAGDPKKVTAFEAWLFDKSDIRTVTTVLASEYAFNEPDLRAKLEPKGDIQQLAAGQSATIETSALRIEVRVKELEYAQGNLPEHSFTQKVTFELRAWVKAPAADAA